MGGWASGFSELMEGRPVCLSFPNSPKVHPGGGVSQERDWLTDLQRDPSHAKDTIYNTCTAVVSVSCSPVKASLFRQQAGPTPAHAAAKGPSKLS